ncbi:MAG: aspartyl/asparaginyl beta-hydroxylase domain-containing protein [Crocinitomicaceae bacterium]
MSSKNKIWYSAHTSKEYEGEAPVFYDTHKFEWNKRLEENYATFYEELQRYLNTDQKLQAYFDQNLVSRNNSWKTIALMAWGVKFHKKMKQFPQTMKVLNTIPGLVSVSFNLLEPHSEIKPHFGDTNAIARCHFGLEIPGVLPEIGFRVKNEERSWEKGKLLAFCDGYVHTAWNYTDKPRFILLFDIILPEFESHKNSVCSTVLSSLFLQSTAGKMGVKKDPPKWVVIPLFISAKYAAWVSRPIYNFFGKLLK